MEQVTAVAEKINEKQLKCCINAKERERQRKRHIHIVKEEEEAKNESVEIQTEDDMPIVENNDSGQIIEIPGVLDGELWIL